MNGAKRMSAERASEFIKETDGKKLKWMEHAEIPLSRVNRKIELT